MKHEYLIDLLKNNKTVIIPNIGAISSSDNAAHAYIFNEYLKFDDGMIVKYISTKEGKSLDDAGEDLDKFTQGFSDLLSQGKEVVIPQIGILSKVDGKTIFHCDTNVTSGSKVTPPPIEIEKVEPVEEKKPEPVVEIKPETRNPKPETVLEKKPEPIIEKKPEPVVEIKSETPNSKSVILSSDSVSKGETVNPKPVTQSNDSVSKSKPKKKRKLVWIILLIVLLGGGGTAGFIFKDQLMEMVGMNETTASNEEKKETNKNEVNDVDKKDEVTPIEESNQEVEAVEETESTENSSETVEEVIEEPIVDEIVEEKVEEVKVPVQAATSSPGNYYIIVGCYSNHTNADNMISKISAAGMSPVNVGTFNTLIHVAAGSASDMQGALQQLNSVKGTFPSAWIMKQ